MGRVLLFTGATGGGHTQVANTLRAELEKHGHEIIISDLLVDFSKFVEVSCVDFYTFMYRHIPRFYGVLYRWTDRKIISGMSSVVFNMILGRKLTKFINEENPDIIISVHPFGSGVLGRLRRKGKINCTTTALITDFSAHWTHIGKGLDYYMVCGDYTKSTLVRRGVDPDNVRSMGIPIRSDFVNKSNNEMKKDGEFTVLVMGGSEGEKFIERSLFWIARNREIKLIVVCGKNKALKERLERRYRNKTQIDIRGFEKNISELMAQSDIIITKPGAITVTEAISQELPIVIPYAIPGHESANARFLVKSGVALRTHSYLWLAHVVERTMKHPDILENMRNNIQEKSVKYSTDEIVDVVDEQVMK